MTPRQVAEALRQAGNLPELLREAGGALEAVGIICNHLEEACALCPDFEALALAIEADDAVREQLVAALTDMRQWVARICKAHGWILDCRDRPIEEGYWPLVRGWAEGTDEPICLPPAILAALAAADAALAKVKGDQP